MDKNYAQEGDGGGHKLKERLLSLKNWMWKRI